MRLANVAGRAGLVTERGVVDIASASGGRFPASPAQVLDQWDEVRAWADDIGDAPAQALDVASLGAPSPAPRQVFGIGLNYRSHAAETGRDLPEMPAVFTKFPASLSGPFDPILLQGDHVDWEVELVVVIGRRADHVAAAAGWSHVAGVCVGQDVSDRVVQRSAGAQFSMGKSFRTYGPTGPWMVTPDELDDPDDLELSCTIDGEVVQTGRTSDLVFSVPELVEWLSRIVPLLPGDLIFTGTPAGVGAARTPPRFLQVGQTVESTIDGVGTIRNHVVAPAAGPQDSASSA